MHVWYLISVWLHILAAAVWIGGMAFLGLVLVPVVRGRGFESVRTSLLYETGIRLRRVGWVAIGLLVVTGIVNLGIRGYAWSDLWDGTFLQDGWGRMMGVKLLLVLLVLGISVWHDFFMGPRATRVLSAGAGSTEAMRVRRVASIAGRLMLLISLVILAIAVMLVRGW